MGLLTRLLFLEVDAGDKVLIQKWAAEGTLPTFQSLLARGLVGDTMSLEGFFVGGIWPSLYTGVSPARHGIHSLVQQQPGTYDFVRCPTGEHIKREPFWNYLSRAGKRVAIFDIPLSGLSRELNGIQTVEWGSHDANYGFCTSPPELQQEIETTFGQHPLTQSCNAYGRRPEDFAAFRDLLIRGVRTKCELTRHYLRQGSWDFFAQVFTESHCVGHQCWHLHDPAHPGHDPEVVAITGDPIRDVYVAIDRAIGEILAEVDDETLVVVLAGHRMAHKCGAQFLLPEILVRLGVATPRSAEEPPRPIDYLDNALGWGWQRTPAPAKTFLEPLRGRIRHWIDERDNALPPSVSQLDAKNSKCFLTDNGFPVSGLRLNVVGREPNGVIRLGKELDEFAKELTEELLAITDLDTGRPAVRSVKKTADLYSGEYLDQLPDLLVEWADEKPLGSAGCGNPTGSKVRLGASRIGIVEGINSYCRTGDHRPEGLFVAMGSGIRPGRLNRTVSIMDFAPTFTRFLGLKLPNIDGSPILELPHARAPAEHDSAIARRVRV